jgi:hypothetical protein
MTYDSVSHLTKQSQLPKARTLADPRDFMVLVVIYCEAAILNDIERIPCALNPIPLSSPSHSGPATRVDAAQGKHSLVHPSRPSSTAWVLW